MKHFFRFLVFCWLLLFATTVFAQTKVVVIPMGGNKAVGDATAQDVVEGKTFSSDSGTGLTGTRSPGIPATTGQTLCYDTVGDQISCTGTGQDGEVQKGVAVTPRFINNGDGTVTDNLTGLIWLQEGNCTTFFAGDAAVSNSRPWQVALDAANQLASGYCGLTDGSAAGDWRLPNLRELQSLVDYSQISPSLPAGNPFLNTVSSDYWSSTTYALYTNYAWLVNFSNGSDSYYYGKSSSYYVRAVRGGQ
jgi:hypothetical protein